MDKETVMKIRNLRRETIPRLKKLLRAAEAEERYLKIMAELGDVDIETEVQTLEAKLRETDEEDAAGPDIDETVEDSLT